MAFTPIHLLNLTELKSRRGNSTDTTLATIIGLNYPPDEAFAIYIWNNSSTETPDDNEIVQPTIGGITTGRWYRIDLGITSALVIAALGFVPYDTINPDGFISSYTETDPIWIGDKPSYRTKAQNDLLYQAIGSYLTSETDPTVPSFAKSLTSFAIIKALTDALYEPIFSKNTAFNKNFGITLGTVAEGNDSRILNGQTAFGWGNHALAGYLTSFTESDPTVPAYAKTLNAFSVIKSSTDPLYRPISYVPSWTDITSKPTTIGGFGITDFNSLGDARWSLLGHTHTFASLTSKPTTLGGYGITDAYPLTGNPSGFLTSFTESDPTVPAYSKSLTAFSVIKSSTDPLYKAIGYTPTSLEITTALGYTPVTNARTITINGVTFDLTANRTWTIAGVTSVGITGSDFSISGSPITSSGNIALALSTTGITAGTYGRLTVDAKGRATAGKRQETYSGVTDASGNYTVVFGTAYSVAPNIQVCLVNPNVRDTPLPVVSTTGFTVNVQRRADVIGLLPTYSNVVGGAVDVLITEK